MKVRNYKIFFFTIEIMVESLFLLHLATNLLKRNRCDCQIRNWPETDLLEVKWLPHLGKLPSHCSKFLVQKASGIQCFGQLESFRRISYYKISFNLSPEINLKLGHTSVLKQYPFSLCYNNVGSWIKKG